MNTFEYRINELPTIEDKNVLCFLCLAERIKPHLHDLAVASGTTKTDVRVRLGIVTSMLNRILECSTSVAYLILKGRTRDASILLLNIYELKLDLEYISLKKDRENIWLEHNKKNLKPWKVDDQLKEISKSENEYLAEKEFYRNLSMIKHGNYAGNEISFSLSIRGDKIIMKEPNEEDLFVLIFAMSAIVYKSGIASISILHRIGEKFPDIERKLASTYNEFEEAFFSFLSERVKNYIYEQNPEIRELDEKIKILKDEQRKLEFELKKLNDLK